MNLYAQKITISGYISDSESGERLIGANVFELSHKVGSTTNEHGFYSLTMPKGAYLNLIFSYVGYQTDTLRLTGIRDSVLQVSLAPTITLSAVEVRADARDPIQQSTQMSEVDMPVKDIQRLPAILGEVDVIKALQLMPGVKAGNEGFAGLYVRGGSPDQNLVLLDGVPIYNPSHVLGIFSVFNADAIKNVSLIKGGFPARYGGRLSSVLNINMKEGNLNSFHGEGAISNIASKLTLEGPIKKGTTSFLLSARRTYLDVFFSPFVKSQSDGLDKLATYFYDLNGKLQHRINDKHSLHLSFYTGKDVFKSRFRDAGIMEVSGGDLGWQNQIGALRWNYNINSQLFLNTTLSSTDYKINSGQFFKNEETKEEAQSNYVSGIKDYAARAVLEWIPSTSHYVRVGGNWINHTYRPGATTITRSSPTISLDTLLGIKSLGSMEYNFFAEDEWDISKRVSMNVGLHYSGFDVENQRYTSLQPRWSMRFQVLPKLSIKSSFATMTQYINLLSSESLGLPSDLWVPSTARIKPQNAWQAAVGIATGINDTWDFTLEGFYKKMDNVLSYTEGAVFEPNLEADWQDKVEQGTGEVYGAEVFLNKKQGKTTGWIGYTLSWNWRQFDNINAGLRYPFRYDRRHDLSLVVIHQQNERIGYSFSWVYGTGNAITIPTSRYAVTPNYNLFDIVYLPERPERFVTEEKNSFRMSATHRLDASVSFYKEKPKFERKWIISVYNVYSRVNPFYVRQDEEFISEGTIETRRYFTVLKEVGILPIIPSVAYTFKF